MEKTILKETALTKKHHALGARMAAFAGYSMPISYSGIKEEHLAVRNNVGVFDVSHMGEFIVRGRQAMELIQQVTSNDVSRLAIGQAQYSCLPNTEGGIVDDLLVYRLDEDRCSEGEKAFMLVVNAGNIRKDWEWIRTWLPDFDAEMYDISEKTGLLAVQGPNATAMLQHLTNIELSTIQYYTFVKGKMAGIENVLISATGYTGSGGFELYVEAGNLEQLWDAVFDAGKTYDVMPVGLGARDSLRLEMGYCLYGNDIDDTTSPLEAGLGWITKLKKDNFNAAEIFRQQKAAGLKRKLVGFKVNDRRVPRHGYPIEDPDGNEIGSVTSGTASPSLEIPIGMGYVPVGFAKESTRIQIVAGRKKLEATVVKMPFYKVQK